MVQFDVILSKPLCAAKDLGEPRDRAPQLKFGVTEGEVSPCLPHINCAFDSLFLPSYTTTQRLLAQPDRLRLLNCRHSSEF
jgi:hypothetical protein